MFRWSAFARRIRVPLGFGLVFVYFWLAQPTFESILVGVVLVVAGLLMRASASGHLRKNEQLTRSGPYAYTRNPLYLGSLVLAAGFGLAARNWWIGAILLIYFLAIYLPVIFDEERFLRQRFPDFDAYARSVPRILPRYKAQEKNPGSFSWDLYWKHREYNAALGSGTIVAILIAKLLWS